MQNFNLAWQFNFRGKISWIVIEKLVKSSWDKIIWGKLLSTSAGMLFLYCNMSFWQAFCSMYSNNLAPIYYPTLIWQVFSTKNIEGKLLSTSAGMEFPLLNVQRCTIGRGGVQKKFIKVHIFRYEIYVSNYLLVWKKTRAVSGNVRNNVF